MTDLAVTDPDWGIAWSPAHIAVLTGRAVSREVAGQRQYRSVQEHATLERAGFSGKQGRAPGLLIPLHNAHGTVAGFQYRPDHPRLRDGKPIKYENRPGSGLVLDVPPSVQPALGDPSRPLWFTEGPIKADAAVSAGIDCVALLGVYGWRGTNTRGGSTILGDFEAVALNGRPVVLAFDSDAWTKPQVYDALTRFAGFLQSRQAQVRYCLLPDGPNGEKWGIDDWLAAGNDPAELDTLIASNPGPRPNPPVTEDAGTDGHHFTDLGNAHRLIAYHGHQIHYVPAWGTWLVWDGTRYAADPGDVRIMDLAGDVARQMWKAGVADGVDRTTRDKQFRWAARSESAAAMGALVRLGRSLPGVAIRHDDLDSDLDLLNVENGVIDLKTAELLSHDPDRLITKMAGARFHQDATAPTWATFLARVLPDPDVRSYVQRAVGYSLSGDVSEQVLMIATGVGSNGKSTFLGTVSRLLGDYAATAPKDLLLATNHEPHPTSMTQLFGVRFAAAVETEAGAKLAEAQVKQLTGGDDITARRMREDFWTFRPTHKLWLGCNHLPKINGRDHAIWRRIRVIPFDVVITDQERDPHLPSKLEAEMPGILNWALEGYRMWKAEGLNQPQAVVDATAEYRRESDWLVRFLDDAGYELTPGEGRVLAAQLRDDIERWCRSEGLQIGQRQYAEALGAAGCESVRTNSSRFWKGIVRNDS